MKLLLPPITRIQDALYFQASAVLQTDDEEPVAVLFAHTTGDGGTACAVLDTRIDQVLPLLDGIAGVGEAVHTLVDARGLPAIQIHGSDPDDATFRAKRLLERLQNTSLPPLSSQER